MTTDDDKKAMRKFDRALRQVRTAIDPLVPTQMVQAFITVGFNEGQTLGEIAQILNTNISTCSRQLLDLGARNRKMEQGYMLVESRADPMNLRINRYSLTPKGRMLFKELATIMRD